ncbi:hypothetical protein [Streptomyces sp.]|uniref:hypothetical protein n=1 Tax=Streptomyces sp. TaxID=1931 RepID=UPI002F40CC5A
MKRTVLTAALICATAAGVLSGCGDGEEDKAGAPPSASAAPTTTAVPKAPFEGLTAQQISDRAVTAMKALSSVTIDFDGTDSGQKIRMKAAMTNAGKCVSHIVLGGGNLELIGVGTDTFAKGDTAFWNAQAGASGPAVNALLKGRWMKMPAGSGQDDDFKSFCDLSTFMAGFTESGSGTPVKGAPTVVAGRTTVPISSPDDGGTTTVYVAAEGEPYILKAVHTGSDPGSAVFTDFDKPLNAVAPPASQTVDASALGG